MLDRYMQQSSSDEPTIYGRLALPQGQSVKPLNMSSQVATRTRLASISKKIADFDSAFNRT
ncbi:hypothetical protein QBC43DRAFT_293991 [Cladorrhinum sp. PSN259]|nr:hypothetical protein QBC43DRAFT_293991 [Cladorrhinum sp. PSN259]